MDKQVVAVTGLSGMVGQRFKQLFSDQYQMESLDLSAGVDITNPKLVNQIIRTTKALAVIHLAAFTNVTAAHEQNGVIGGTCYQVNVVGTQNVANACKKYHKYLIHISTDFVFDGTKDTAYTEEDEPHPIEWYGMTKYLAEQIIKGTLRSYVILRLAYPYQKNPVRPDFLANIVEKLKAGTLLPQFDDHQITPTYVDDFARVLDYCLDNKPQGLYHACGSSSQTNYEIACQVKDAYKLSGQVVPGKLDDYLKTINRPYQRNLIISNQKLLKDFQFNMKTFSQGLTEITTNL